MITATITNKVIDTTNIKNLSIAEDSIDTVRFTLAKAYEGTDLSAGTVYSLWSIPGGQGDMTELATSVDGDNLLIDWPLKEGVVSRKGMVEFQIVVLIGSALVYHTKIAHFFVDRKLAPATLTFTPDVLTAHLASVIAQRVLAEAVLEDGDLQTVAEDLQLGEASLIKTVGANKPHIDAVAEKIADVSIVAAGIADIDRVEDIAADITAVALIADEVSAVADNATDIGIVATDLALGLASKIKIVSASIASVNTVAGLQTQVTALGAIVDEMLALYAIGSHIVAVSLIDDAVSALALLTTQITALGARTTEIDALYAQLDTIAAKANQSDMTAAQAAITTLNADSETEGSVAKTVKDAVEPIIDDVSDHEIRIAVLESVSPLTSWDDIQKVAKAGVARKYLKAGDLIETSYDGNPAVVEVVGINQDTPPEGTENYQDVISFQFKDCLQNAQYSAPQALYNAVEGLDAGSYTFINSNDSLPYTFTIAQALPAGGVIVITSWGVGAYEPTVLKTMQADRLTNIETGVAVTQASGGTALAPVNLTPRCRYGANLYIESGIRHFLNDNSESYLWVAQGLYDMPSTYGAGGGFLKRLDADFASVIGPVVKKVARATVDGDGQDTTEDKVWLLSRVEMGYGTEGVTTGEQVYERWNGATNAERIKLLSGSPRYWWLRPPYVSSQNSARSVNTGGALTTTAAATVTGLPPGLQYIESIITHRHPQGCQGEGMSVPEGKRTESKLRVQTRSRELARHTMQLCSNEKIFPKRDRWILSSRIMDTALAIMENVDFANDIQAVTPVDFALRRKSQTIALASTAKMIGLIDLAYTRYGIEGSRVSYWVGLVLEVRELVKKWRQSDKTRFESLMKGRS